MLLARSRDQDREAMEAELETTKPLTEVFWGRGAVQGRLTGLDSRVKTHTITYHYCYAHVGMQALVWIGARAVWELKRTQVR